MSSQTGNTSAFAAPEPFRYFAPCPRGLEQALATELLALGATLGDPVHGGVAFSGDRALAYAANLHSRIASRILLLVATGRYRDDDDLYRLANRCEWERWFDVKRTLRVDVTAIRSPVRSLNFVTLRIKDGIVDRFRTRTGVRPSIDTHRPDVNVYGFLNEDGAALYIDLSGEPLFKRGWRAERDDKGEAPLKENLAAGLLALAGWSPGMPLYDPFCGSGTIVIEAAQVAAGIAPGLSRGFAFERLLDFDSACWAELRGDAVRRAQAANAAEPSPIAASDIDQRSLEQVRRNAQRASLPEHAIQVSRCDARDMRPPFEQPGMILTNPPYGERLELHAPARRGSPVVRTAGDQGVKPVGRTSADDQGWQDVGRAVKDGFGGWRLWILTSDMALPRQLGMKERRRTPLFNGAIECRLFGFEIFAPGADGVRPSRGARSPG